jgi:hypothetical protein
MKHDLILISGIPADPYLAWVSQFEGGSQHK